MKFLSALTLLLSCNNGSFQGQWEMYLDIHGKDLPFNLTILKSKATIQNSSELIELDYEETTNEIRIPIKAFDSLITLKKNGDSLNGYWEKLNKNVEYKIPLNGKKVDSFRKVLPSHQKLPTKWKITFTDSNNKKSEGILIFTKDNASILTQTGDYRFLRADLKNNTLKLFGFDGVFSFIFEGKIENNQYTGRMYSGKDWSEKFVAIPDSDVDLKDAYSITKISKESLNVCLETLSGKKKCLNENNGKAKIIQIFGSWCPNCIDETVFIKNYRSQNKSDIEFMIVSFERSPNKETALRLLRKTKDEYEIDYPILLAGFTSETKVGDVLKGIDNFLSFPTTIFVDKKGDIIKVHAGFSGPATGKYYDQFSMDFNNTVKKLLLN